VKFFQARKNRDPCRRDGAIGTTGGPPARRDREDAIAGLVACTERKAVGNGAWKHHPVRGRSGLTEVAPSNVSVRARPRAGRHPALRSGPPRPSAKKSPSPFTPHGHRSGPTGTRTRLVAAVRLMPRFPNSKLSSVPRARHRLAGGGRPRPVARQWAPPEDTVAPRSRRSPRTSLTSRDPRPSVVELGRPGGTCSGCRRALTGCPSLGQRRERPAMEGSAARGPRGGGCAGSAG